VQGLILAAGCGRRMRPLSDRTHKALLPIGGTTILRRLVDSLRAIGIETIMVVTGYRADDVRAHLLEAFPGLDFRWVHNGRYADTNNIVSLALAMESLEGDDDVLLSECDLLLDAAALSPLVEGSPGSVALVDRYRQGMDGTVVTAEDGYVTDVVPPARQGAGFVYEDKLKTLNVYRFEAGFCRTALRPLLRWYAEEVDAGWYYEQVLGVLIERGERIAAAVVPPGSWVEVDDPNDLAVARFRFEPEARAAILDRALGGHWAFEVTDFSFMRNEYFPTDAMVAAMRHALPDLIGGYGSSQQVLDEKLSWFVDCDPVRLVALNGASQAFPILREQLAGRRVATPAPTFGEYPRSFPAAETYEDSLAGYGDALDRTAAANDVLVVVSPNNPTGTTIATDEVHALARRHPDTLVVVDESFGGFSSQPSLVPALESEPLRNVVVLVSLSKTLGVPGLRIGYAYSPDTGLAESIRSRLPVWNMNGPAEFFMELLLKFRTEFADSLRRTIDDRETLRRALAAVDGVDAVHAGGGNFVLARLVGDAAQAATVRSDLLTHEAIEVKDASRKLADGRGWLRVAARRPELTERFVSALERRLQAT
jgi:histidinol-phosphate/aromatic aminotransferase/cobyric acid decarboxylase-like protein